MIYWLFFTMALLRINKRGLTCVLTALLITLTLFMVFGERGLLHLWRLSEEKRRLDESNLHLQRRNEILREQIYRLRHDPRYLEKVAREELGLVLQGEIVYRFATSESRKRAGEISAPFSQRPRSAGQK